MSIERDRQGGESCTTSESQYEEQDKSIQQLRSLLLDSSLPCQQSKNSGFDADDTGCGSFSPISSSCPTPPNGEDSSSLSSPMWASSSEASVGSNLSDGEQPDQSSHLDCEVEHTTTCKKSDFFLLRTTYLLVTLVIMLADGLQGKQDTSIVWLRTRETSSTHTYNLRI